MKVVLKSRADGAGVTIFATSVLPLFAGNDQYEVMSCEVTENRLYLKVVNHRLEMEVRKGDIVQAGVMISNSEVGLGAVSIQPLVYRLVCTNGMVVNDMGERRHHVGRQAKAVEDSFTLYSDETMEAEDKRYTLRNNAETLRLKDILFQRTKAEMDAYHDMSRKPESWTAEDIAHQRIRFCSIWQVIEEAELVDEYEAWKEANPNA